MKKHKNILPTVLIMSLMTLAFSIDARPEVIFLKDGSLVQGAIIRDAAGHIDVRKEDKSIEKVLRKDIMRILYTKLNMGKVYVQKRDGKGVTAFMVDEDQETYTFRKELYSPDEFKLKRSEVLFIAERNPSGLKGEAETDRVALEWFPSYDPMKHYNIYVKKKGENFALADSSKKASFVLRGLMSNTEYTARVTGVDREETETTPSNEFKFLTKNVPPERPGKVMKKQDAGGAMTLSWDAAEDRDGKVTGYRLYSKVKGKRTLVGETGKTAYTVQDAPRYKRVELTAVDDRGDESGPAFIRLIPSNMKFAMAPGIVYPLGTFAEMGGPGYGGMLSFMLRDLFVKGLTAGVEGGYFYLQGEDALETKGQKVERFQMAPFAAKAGYAVKLGATLAIIPSLSVGGAYVDIGYVSADRFDLTKTDKESKGIDLLGIASLSLEWDMTETWFLGAHAGYGMLFEKEEYLGFAIGGVYFGVRF